LSTIAAQEQAFSSITSRQDNLEKILITSGLDALVLNPGPSLTYFTGLHFHLMERPVVVIFRPAGKLTIVMPELELEKVRGLPFQLDVVTFGDNPVDWQSAYNKAAQSLALDHKKIGVEPIHLRVLELWHLETAIPTAQFISAQEFLATSRMHKDKHELQAMHKAAEIAQLALQNTMPMIKIGVTERQIAAELTTQLLRAGSDSTMPFAPIVSGGPNSANPHATPSERPLSAGDLLVIDWGAAYDGYCSDLTRTFAIGEVDVELKKIAQVVEEANEAGRAAARPGIAAGEIDNAARTVIEKAGYGKFFTHRVGHGLGLEEHEDPYMYAANPLLLAPGMTFTVEPGIYLPGRGGVRIEDDVAITVSGADILSDLPRQLLTVR
jgi:Xaa-Pro dipeptidase